MTNPVFSLCHTTARTPDGWRKAANAWLAKCDHPENVEYVLSVDAGVEVGPLLQDFPEFGRIRVVVNSKRKCSVDGWNRAAQASTGQFLITIADDILPCEHWDTEILKIVDLKEDVVLDVDSGAGTDPLITFVFATRPFILKLCQKYGYEGFFYPEYTGVYCDTEFTELARFEKVVRNAKHLYFEHLHPIFGKSPMDDVYRKQNAKEEYAYGKEIFVRRMAELVRRTESPVISLVCPGEWFSRDVMFSRMSLLADLYQGGYRVQIVSGYGSNVYVVRACLSDSIRFGSTETPHLILWMDDDNPCNILQLNQLLEDLNQHPELDGIAGWSWVQGDLNGFTWRVSCGSFDENGIGQAMKYSELLAGTEDVKEVAWTGFPMFILRYPSFLKAGQEAFHPIVNAKHPWGFLGEDLSFCLNAAKNGLRFGVDRRVKLEHQKLLSTGPTAEQLKKLEEPDPTESELAPVTGRERRLPYDNQK